jgi:nitrogen fixation protein FixH
MSTTATGGAKPGGIRGGHVLAAMLAFFAVIIVADTTLIYRALTTFGGVDNPNAYRQGVAYNQRIARDARQSLIGWQDEIVTVAAPERLRLTLRDPAGTAVGGKKVSAKIGRPATNRFDASLELTEVAPGQYEVPLPKAGEGAWIVDLNVYDGGASTEPLYQARRRVWITP